MALSTSVIKIFFYYRYNKKIYYYVMKLIIIAILLLIIAYVYFCNQKYIEIPKEEKESFKNVNIHKFNDCNDHGYNL